MTNFVFKWLTSFPEIENTQVWVFLNIWRLSQVRDTKLGSAVSNEKLLNVAKSHGCSSYHFLVIKGKAAGMGRGGGRLGNPSTQIRIN